MKKLFTLAAALLMGVAAFAQKSYVSTPIVKAMESGKFYMRFDMVQGGYSMSVETAFRAGVSMSRVDMSGKEFVSMLANGKNYSLDEAGKTWSIVPMGAAPSVPSKLNFVRQGKCLVNGQKGWYFDEYEADGNTIKFYYNSDKVSIIELADSGPMLLRSFSSTIPSRMYFCIGKGWRGSGATPPPQCSHPWTDSGTPVELAGGSGSSSVSVSGSQSVSSPVYASTFTTTEVPRKPRMDRKVTEEGVWLAIEQIAKEAETKTNDQLEDEFLDYNAQISRLYFSGIVTGEMAEGCIARACLYPHPAILTTTADLLMETGDVEMAKKYYEYAIEMDATVTGPRYGLLEYYLDKEDYTHARGVVNHILEMGPNGLEDGRAYLYKAMLQLRKGEDMAAVTSLFKSLSLGYFDDNSIIMLTSVLNEIENNFTLALDGSHDPMPLVHEVFSESNLALLRKGITYSRENEIHPSSTEMTFGAPAPHGLEALRVYNRGKSNAIDKRAQAYSKIADNSASNDPALALCLSKGMGYIMEGNEARVHYVANVLGKGAQSHKEGQEAAAEAKEVATSVAQFTMGSYDRLTTSLGALYGVNAFYLPDLRAFWCLYTLNMYHEFLSRYEFGQLHKNFHPAALRTMDAMDKATDNKYNERYSALSDVHLKKEMEMAKKCQKLYDDWFEAHPDASDSTIARAERRFFLPYRVMSRVDHPLERMNQIDIPRDEESLSNNIDYYNACIKPTLTEWWKDMDYYSQFCLDPGTRNWFRFSTCSSLLKEWGLIVDPAASLGENFSEVRKRYERIRAALKEQEYKDRDESLKEFKEDLQGLLMQEELMPKNTVGFFGDFNAKLTTPLGDIRFGLIEGKWGWKREDNIGFKDYLALAAQGTVVGDILHRLGVAEINPSRETQIREQAKKMLADKGQEYLGSLIGSTPVSAVAAAIKARQGELIKRSEERSEEWMQDSKGNYWRKRARGSSVNFDDRFSLSSRDISAGGGRVRRDGFEVNLPGISFDFGQYSRTRH